MKFDGLVITCKKEGWEHDYYLPDFDSIDDLAQCFNEPLKCYDITHADRKHSLYLKSRFKEVYLNLNRYQIFEVYRGVKYLVDEDFIEEIDKTYCSNCKHDSIAGCLKFYMKQPNGGIRCKNFKQQCFSRLFGKI